MLVWHLLSDFIELRLKLISVLVRLLLNLLLSLLLVPFLLLGVHRFNDLLHLRLDLLQSLVGCRELSLIHLLRILVSLQVSQCLVKWHHCFLVLA